ncbi:MAG TPA: tetratricopeptide repeat protein [Thermoanaerobaculia bacterium]|nr:tetratricopeptide repeat protein [Thermoanaerobaculia bacterium]
MKAARRPRLAAPLLLALGLGGCTQYAPFDSAAFVRGEYEKKMGADAAGIVVPFELDAEIRATLKEKFHAGADEQEKVDAVRDFIFNRLELQYSLLPTRDAVETYKAHEGNCLSFVNLFVGIGRAEGLNPFYVEVTDLQKWNRRAGLVVSQGHIVSGVYVKGKLTTYDFLPYRPKAYKNFKPIDDLTAAAHYYNNLGAEALLAGDVAKAKGLVEIATRIAPTFDKALNNLGVCYARMNQVDRALEAYQQGLKASPDNSLILTNVARAYQQLGRTKEAAELLSKIEAENTTNPYFFIYEGEVALAQGDTQKALDYMVRAFKQDTELPEVQLGFVKVYLALGDMIKARHHLERALKLDATNPEAREFARMLAK